MEANFRKTFVNTCPLTDEPVTILVEYIKTKKFQGICIESLKGDFKSPEEFETAYQNFKESLGVIVDQIMKTRIDNSKIKENYKFIPMTIDSATHLRDMLNEAIEASRA